MADALLRQWNLLQRIPPYPRKISTAVLKSHLNDEGIAVEMRTLQRDLNFLSQLFPLVQDDHSKPYGWSWAEYSR